jgi:hypothetical protein
MSYTTPVLLIAWRRPDAVSNLLKAIRPVAPARLFVACDGPNQGSSSDFEKVNATREVIETEINWPCKTEKLYSDSNQGCRLSVSKAITWFFSHVEEGIILEDDCIPHPDFFSYCSSLLERYRHDHRVWSICGSNFQLGRLRGDASYYFSIHGDSWGWATWRRSWKYYEAAEQLWFPFRDSGKLADVFPIPEERLYWQQILDTLFIDGKPSAWDYQWWLASWMNYGIHAWPNKNLVTNTGFGRDGTHTFGDSEFAALPLVALGPISHPDFVVPSTDADQFAFLHRRSGIELIEHKKYKLVYPWILRYRQLRKEGFSAYISRRLARLDLSVGRSRG